MTLKVSPNLDVSKLLRAPDSMAAPQRASRGVTYRSAHAPSCPLPFPPDPFSPFAVPIATGGAALCGRAVVTAPWGAEGSSKRGGGMAAERGGPGQPGLAEGGGQRWGGRPEGGQRALRGEGRPRPCPADGGCLSPQPPGRRPGLGAADAGRQPPPPRQDRGARPPAGPAAPGPVREPHPPHRGAERPGEPAHPESVRQPDNESGGSAVFVSVRLAA